MKRFFDGVNLLLLVGMVAFALWGWPHLPDRIPNHFGISGEPDAWTEGRGFWPWFGIPTMGMGIALMMNAFRWAFPRWPRWVNLPDGRKLGDLPEVARGPVLEMLAGFLALVQAELLAIFGLIQVATFRSAMGESTQALMLTVLIMAVLMSPLLMVVFFTRFPGALREGEALARKEEAGVAGEGATAP